MAPLGPQDTRASRILLGVTISIAITLAFMGMVVSQVVLHLISHASALPPRPSDPQCREGQTRDCDEGMLCQGGRCVPVARTDACELGDSCEIAGATCTCKAPLRCQEGTCQAPEKVLATCEDPAVIEVLRGIAETCQGDLTNCPDTRLEQFAIKSQSFERVLAMFPNTLTLHFPNGQPSIERGPEPWPVDPERAYYRKRLADPAVLAALGQAQEIVIIGRSSQGGDEGRNYRFSRQRTQLVVSMLIENVGSPAEETALRGKIKQLLLGSQKIIEPNFFRTHYSNRLVAWSAEAEAKLRANVADVAALRGEDHKWTRNVMNQVVFVVPIPCKLPAVQGAR